MSVQTVTPLDTKPRSHRIEGLDSLRGIAALAVLMHHYTRNFEILYGHSSVVNFQAMLPMLGTLDLATMAVNLFYIISGFVIFMTVEKINEPVDFVKSRFSRLYPAYWVAVCLTFAVTHAFGLPGREVSLPAALANLTMLQGFTLGRIPLVDGVYWTLQMELTFYTLMLVVIYIGAKERIEKVVFGWLCIGLVPWVLTTAGVPNGPWFTLYRQLVMVQYMGFFIAGVVLYRMRQRVLPIHYGLLIFCLGTSLLYNPPLLAFAAAGAAAVVWLAANNKMPWLKMRPLVFFGAISYSLYLVHQNIGFVVLRTAKSNGIDTALAMIPAAIISIVLAYAITYTIEQPALRYLRNKWNLKKSGNVSPSGLAASPVTVEARKIS